MFMHNFRKILAGLFDKNYRGQKNKQTNMGIYFGLRKVNLGLKNPAFSIQLAGAMAKGRISKYTS